MKRLMLLMGTVLFAGCSTVVRTADAPEVPHDRVSDEQLVAAGPGTGTVIVKRDDAFAGAGGGFRVWVDGVKVASINNGEKVTLHLVPGEHIISLKDWTSDSPFAESSVTVKGDDMHVFRVQAQFGQTATMMPTTY